MSSAEVPPPEVVVGDDGSLSVPAETLIRFGIRPGTHLRLVAEHAEEPRPNRQSAMGILEGKIDVEAFEEGLAWGKQDRIKQVMRKDDEEQ